MSSNPRKDGCPFALYEVVRNLASELFNTPVKQLRTLMCVDSMFLDLVSGHPKKMSGS